MNTATLIKLLSLLQAGVNFYDLMTEIKAKKASGATDADIDAFIDQVFEEEASALEAQE